MARIRTIKPDFFSSEDITLLTPLARLFYVSLWCESDKEGRFEFKPGTLKNRYFPADKADINKLMDELLDGGLVKLYQPEGYPVLGVVCSFKKHQVINNRESESVLPPFSADAALTRESGVKAEGRKEGKEGRGKEGRKEEDVRVDKRSFGEFGHVRLSDDELKRLIADFPFATSLIKKLDEYIETTPTYKKQNHNVILRGWVLKAVNEDEVRAQKSRPLESKTLKFKPETEGASDVAF
jgi:hypothetical protein